MKSEMAKQHNANFVSSLQKANCEQNSKQYRWLEQCYEVVISAKSDVDSSTLPIDGGSDAGMFCVIGAQFDPSRIIYHGVNDNNNNNNNNNTSKCMKPGDIILAINGYELSGYTKRDAITLCTACLQSQSHVRLHLSPPHALATSSTMLSSFLAISFAMDSPEYALQEKIRENVYQRVVPCTTRLPRAEEVDGVHYRFMNVPQFLALERSGQLLESGMYKGNHYGTPRPDPDSTALDSLFLEQFLPSSSTDISQISDDACKIPPPLPPLSSFNHTFAGGGVVVVGRNDAGVKLGDSVQLPTCSPPPPPPIRNSSITKNSTLACNNNNSSSNINKSNGFLTTLSTNDNNYATKTSDTTNKHNNSSSSGSNSNHNNNNIDSKHLNGIINDFESKIYLPRPNFNHETSLWSPIGSRTNGDNQSVQEITNTLGAVVSTTATSTSNADELDSCTPIEEGIDSFCDQTAYSVDKLDQPGEHVLPYGWEIVQDIKYGTFYIDHINKHTQYEPPTVEDFKTAEKVRLKHLSQYDSLNNNTDNKIVTNVNNNLKSTSIHDTYNNDDNSKKVNGDANTDDDDGVGGRITPVTFCSDLKQLRGPLVTTTLVKSPRGFGFTIIGGSDCNRSAYLQVKHLVPGGPASLNSQLAVGDVMVSVNGTNVLGYTHSQLVSLFQSIPIGASISLLVSQGYRLRRDIGESPNHHMLNTIPANAGLSTPASGVIDISAQNTTNKNTKHGEDILNDSHSSDSHLPGSSRNSAILSHSSLSPPSSNCNSSQELLVRSSPNVVHGIGSNKLRNSQRPEFLKVSIFKQANGFGFTLADHLQGQHVKAISDPVRCGRLRVGDVVVEINDQRVKDMPHIEVVQILKQCPVGKEARLLVQRGGLYTSPLSLLDSELLGMNSLNSLSEQRYRGNIMNHQYVDSIHSSVISQSDTSSTATPPTAHPVNGTVIPTNMMNGNGLIYATPQPQRNHLSSRIGYQHNSGSTGENSISSSSSSHLRAQTPDPYVDRRLGLDSPTHQPHRHHQHHQQQQNHPTYQHHQMSDLVSNLNFDHSDYVYHYSNGNNTTNNNSSNTNGNNSSLTVIHDRRRRVHPVDDSVVGMNKDTFPSGSPNSSVTYGSLLRPGRMLPLRHSQSTVNSRPNNGATNVPSATTESSSTKPAPATAPLCMLPGEFLVHLKRQSTGFGFNLVGGAEENTQVSIGAMLLGGSAQLSGVVRTGDKLISIDGVRVIGATHAEVVDLLDRAAHTVGQVTLGLQRGKVEIDNHSVAHRSSEPVDVVISRSEKGDGFGFFLTNTRPPSLLGNSQPEHSYPGNNNNNNSLQNAEFIAQLVPGSQAERMGLLSVGDQILAVNGIPTCGLHHDEVVRLIRESGNHIALKILPYSSSASRGRKHPLPIRDSVEFPVTLFRGSRGFGFSIRGGQEFNRMPLVVLRIADGGAAQMDGQLKVGDELVEINGYSTIGMSHGQAIEIIQRGGNTMRLIVRRRSSRVKPLAHQHHLSNGLACVTDSRIVTDKQMHRRSFNKHDSSSNWFQRSVAEKNHSSPSNSHNNNNTNSNAHHQSPKKSDFLRWTMRK